MLSFVGQEVHKCFSGLERYLTHVAFSNAHYKLLKLTVLEQTKLYATDKLHIKNNLRQLHYYYYFFINYY